MPLLLYELHVLILDEWTVHIGSSILNEISQVGQLSLICTFAIFQLFDALKCAYLLILNDLYSPAILWASALQFLPLRDHP